MFQVSTSQNGYKANDSSLIASYTIARDVKISLRKGDVSVVLLHFARWYDQHIEPLTKADTGGYNPRSIIGSTTLSNHASGTAMDLRWNKHPLGKTNTLTAGQMVKIREQLKFYDGVIRWGGDYKGRRDEMHYEINKAPAAVSKVVTKIKNADNHKPTVPPKGTPTVPPKPATPPTKPHVAVDGDLGPATIRLWQKIMGTVVDGKISDNDSDLVRAVQKRMRVVDHRVSVDGKLGPQTVGALQRYVGAKVDRIMGPDTVRQLQRRLNTGRF